MNSYIKTAIVLCACIALASAQFSYGGFDGFFDPGFNTQGYNGLSAAAARDPRANTGFNTQGYNGLSAAGAREPRANTGPVVFPPSPPGDPSQTSGVVVGASGYGFVPAGSQGPASPRYFYQGYFLR